MEHYKIVYAQDVKNKKCIILDVRTHMEHIEKHLECDHIHIPLDELNVQSFTNETGLDKDSEIYILCRSGKRACTAAEQFIEAGYPNIHVIEGGIIACEACGIDVNGTTTPPKSSSNSCCVSQKNKSIPLERQVRIAAGLLIALGSLLTLILHPIFILIPAMVGLGLIFAGITDRCGLALILTKAPWNKV